MEAFSLLKYWRGSGGGGGITPTGANLRIDAANVRDSNITTTTTIREMAVDDEEEEENEFFDLEFTVPEEEAEENDEEEAAESDENGEEDGENGSTGGEEDRDFDFTVSSGSTGSQTDANLSLSPSDDLFFKGQFLPIEPGLNSSDSHSKLGSLLKPATKLRVLMLGFKKPKPEKVESNSPSSTAKPNQHQNQNKSFTVKFKVEEVPIVSLFTRENSSKARTDKTIASSEEKRFARDVLQKYLKMVKPLYVRVSKRYGEKLGFSGQLSLLGKTGETTVIPPTASTSPTKKVEGETEANVSSNNFVKSQKQGNLTAGLRVVCKHLGKSRSASSAVAAVPSPVQSKRQDDSLLQQQDGIQSAILHCKRSFNGSRDSDSSLSSALSRSTSDPSYEKSKPSSVDSGRTSLDERKVES